ncbi:hypothetical protein [Tepidimonas sp.]|uniref:hypothetical protein n=1 Tax=Tepidimonas sp. TaxID=2002775 RepID=UPI00391DCDAE
MAIGTQRVAKKFTNVQEAVAVNCDFPLFAEDDVVVKYGLANLTATLDVDYTVQLQPDDYDFFTITPTAALIAKIDALIADDEDEVNQIVVIRSLDYLTEITPQSTFFRNVLAREFDRIAMKFQQLAQKVKSAIFLPENEIDVDGNPSVDMTLPTIAQRIGKVLVFDGTGKPTVSTLTIDEIEAPIEEAQAAADTATAQAVIATTKATEAAADAAAADADRIAAEAARAGAEAAVAAAELGDLGNVDETGKEVGDGLVWDGDNWVPGPAGGGMFQGNNGTVGDRSGDMFRIMDQSLTVNTSIPANKNAMIAGPLTVANGVTLTVENGARLVIV